ncbi:14873_t:CDS:1, partial [Gigaspora rosea]
TSAHSSLRTPNEEAQNRIKKMSNAGVRSKEILSSLCQNDLAILTT